MDHLFILALILIALAFLAAVCESFWPDKPQPKAEPFVKPKAMPKLAPNEQGKVAPQRKQPVLELPPGQIVYCKFCKIFLETEDFVSTHPSGKRHQKAAGKSDAQWYAFLRADEKDTFDPASLDPPQVEEVIVEEPPEEEEEPLEPGWTR